MPAAWHGGPGELVASEAFPGLGVAWVTFGRSPDSRGFDAGAGLLVGDVAGLPKSLLDDGADADEARWRRAVLAILLSKPRIEGEQKEGAGDGVH